MVEFEQLPSPIYRSLRVERLTHCTIKAHVIESKVREEGKGMNRVVDVEVEVEIEIEVEVEKKKAGENRCTND